MAGWLCCHGAKHQGSKGRVSESFRPRLLQCRRMEIHHTGDIAGIYWHIFNNNNNINNNTIKLRICYAIEYNTQPNFRFLSQCKNL